MPLADHLGSILIAVISGAGTVLVTMMKIRGDKSASLPEAYQGLVQEMKAWTSTQLEERDREIEGLKQDVGELKQEVQTWRGKFRVATAYIRVILPLVPDHKSMPPVPESIRDDLDV